MIRRTQTGRPSSDSTAPYTISLSREYTVREFIETILKQYPGEWGIFFVLEERSVCGCHRYAAEYRYGELKEALMAGVFNKKIVSVNARGGWSSMDYYIRVQS